MPSLSISLENTVIVKVPVVSISIPSETVYVIISVPKKLAAGV